FAMKTILLSIAAATCMLAADAGFAYWSGATLKGYDKKLAPKINAQKIASESLGQYGPSNVQISHREGDGQAELHETVDDYFVVQSGEATLVYGGEVLEKKTTAAHEIRGPRIQNGSRQQLGAGDIVHIPAGMPHQLLTGGKHFTYFVIKVQK